MDSQGLSALLRTRQEIERCGGSLRLAGVPPRILRLLELTGMDTVFTLDPAPANDTPQR
jgi:anti-sigma B factor antagonist